MTDEEGGELSDAIRFGQVEHARALLGHKDYHLRLLRDLFGVRATMRGSVLTLRGNGKTVLAAGRAVRQAAAAIVRTPDLPAGQIERIIRDACEPKSGHAADVVEVFPPTQKVVPRTQGQAAYVHSIRTNDLVFCVGPAGSGKTYLAVALAVSALKQNLVRKIVLTRPAVEAGEKLGYLPGDIHAKVNPYLRPLYDALQDMMSPAQMQKYMETDLVEVAPLAFMRGRTLDHAFIILDEGQNCTLRQMKMFLTRLGASSKCVVTGDISQIDLPENEVSGMIEAMHLLGRVNGIGFVRLSRADIIRHRLVQEIVEAYESGQAGGLPASTSDPDSGGGG